MKNIITVDLDTDRKEDPVIIGKAEEFKPEEGVNMRGVIQGDIDTLCEGIKTLIVAGKANGMDRDDIMTRVGDNLHIPEPDTDTVSPAETPTENVDK